MLLGSKPDSGMDVCIGSDFPLNGGPVFAIDDRSTYDQPTINKFRVTNMLCTSISFLISLHFTTKHGKLVENCFDIFLF